MFSDQKPKFSFDLTIHDLTNVPEISGSCYIEVQVRDNKRLKSGVKGKKIPDIESSSSPSLKAVKKASSTLNSTRSLFNKFDDALSKSCKSDNGNNNNKNNNDNNNTKSTLSDGAGSNNNNSNNNNSTSSTSLLGTIKTTTSRRKLHNFKCTFNYNLSCNLRFNYSKRKSNLISNKYLIFRIYYVVDNHKHVGTSATSSTSDSGGSHTQVILLGKLVINLTEYLNFGEPVNNKYLLEDSKVNSILNITMALHELPSNFDFHTQLQIQDNDSSHASSTSLSLNDNNKQHLKKNTTFNVPELERKHVFTGINNVFGDNSNTFPGEHPPGQGHIEGGSTGLQSTQANGGGNGQQPQLNGKHSHRSLFSHYDKSSAKSKNSHSAQLSNASQKDMPLDDITKLDNDELLYYVAKGNDSSSVINMANVGNISAEGGANARDGNDANDPKTYTQGQVYSNSKRLIMDPIVSLLYAKILESSWDPELYPLLDYSPDQCINDIFDNPENPYGCNMKLKSYYDENLRQDADKDDTYRELNGLINEQRYRPNLRSWNISGEHLDR